MGLLTLSQGRLETIFDLAPKHIEHIVVYLKSGLGGKNDRDCICDLEGRVKTQLTNNNRCVPKIEFGWTIRYGVFVV